MNPPVQLYNFGLSPNELDALMEEIRSSSYIDEVESGEAARESSPLFNEVKPTADLPSDRSMESLLKYAGNPRVLAVADKRLKGSVLIVETKDADGQWEELRVAPRDVIEVCCNCRVSNMGLSEFKAMAQKMGSDVYDSQR